MMIIMIIPNRSRVCLSSAPNCDRQSTRMTPGAVKPLRLVTPKHHQQSFQRSENINPSPQNTVHQNTLASKKHQKNTDMI